MISKPLALGLLAAGCLTAAGGGAYLAARHNAVDRVRAEQTAVAPQPGAAPAAQPVAESEGIVGTAAGNANEAAAQPELVQPAVPQVAPETPLAAPGARATNRNPRTIATRPVARRQAAPAATPQSTQPTPSQTAAAPQAERPDVSADPNGAPAVTVPEARPAESQRAEAPAPPVPQLEELVIPASSVIGLQVDTSVSSERARVEDPVQARVTRDVMAGNRVAIPAGARVLGTVTAADKGGKVHERARLDVRFHTLVLADGTEVPLRTETISRYGESPTGESARKIGGAAVGGAILGAIIGGGKGAVIGGATGAAGGTAVVMAGDRNAATLPSGTILSVRVTSPVSIEVEKR